MLNHSGGVVAIMLASVILGSLKPISHLISRLESYAGRAWIPLSFKL